MVMVSKEKQCVQVIGNGRSCSLKATHGFRCHKHKDQSFYARVSYRTGLSRSRLDEVAAAFAEEMGWEQIDAFNRECARGQIYDDAGGYIIRRIAKLFGARSRYDAVRDAQRRLNQMFKEDSKQ